MVALFIAPVASAHAQGEFDGEFNVSAQTESSGELAYTPAPNNGSFTNLFQGGGPHTRSLSIPNDPIAGDNGAGERFSFTPTGKAEFTFENGTLELHTEAAIDLAGTVPIDESADYGYYPEVRADTEMVIEGGILFFPEDTSLHGQRASFEMIGEVTVDRSVLVNQSDTTQAQSAIDFGVGTPPGIDQFEGDLSEYRDEGESDIDSDGPTNLSTPTTVMLFRGGAVLGPAPLNEFGSEFNSFDLDFSTSARVWVSGPSGSNYQAEVTLTVSDIRVSRVTLDEGGAEIPIGQLKSLSSSGYDWIGNGAPELEETSDYTWKNAANGSFATAENWIDTESSLDASSPPSSGESVRFGHNSAYTVDVGSTTIAKLFVGDSLQSSPDVTFINSNLNIDSLSTDPPAVTIESAELTVNGGTVRSNFVAIGRAAGSGLSLENGANWINAGRLELDNFGLLRLSSGSRLSSAETRLSSTPNLDESAFVAISGENTHWQPGNLSIGYHGGADVQASNQAKLTANLISLGTNPDSAGAMTFESASVLRAQSTLIGDQGAGTLTGADLDTDLAFGDLHIGKTATGSLEMSNGATGLAQSLKIGGAFGSLTLTGVGQDQVPTALEIANSPNPAVVGASTTLELDPTDDFVATVDVLDGAFFNVGSDLQIGRESSGSVVVEGWDSDTQDRSTLAVTGEIHIGGLNKGELCVTDGGLAESESFAMDPLSEFRSTAVISGISEGPASKLVVQDTVDIYGSELAITQGAEAELGNVVIGGFLADDAFPDPEEVLPTFRVSGYDPATGSAASAQLDRLTAGNYSSSAPDSFGPGALIVEEGADVSVAQNIRVGFFSSGYGLVDGFSEGSRARSSSLSTDLTLYVGTFAPGEARLEIKNGANVYSQDGALDVFNETASDVVLDGFGGDSNAVWYVEQTLTIGANGLLSLGANGSVTIGEPRVLSGKVTIGAGGTLSGTGVIETDFNPEFQGGVSNFAGVVQPGQSPGTLTIVGDYEQGPEGTLVMEVAGSDPSDQDRLVVSGDVSLAGTVKIIFTNAAPTQGQAIPLVDVGGTYSEENLAMEIQGLDPGFQSRCEVVEGKFTLIAESDGVLARLPEPAPIEPFKLSKDGSLEWTIQASRKVEYVLETSLDLIEWEEVVRHLGNDQPHTFEHPSTDDPRRFYRVTTFTYE